MYDQDCKDDCLKGYLELMPCMTDEGFNCDDTCVAGVNEVLTTADCKHKVIPDEDKTIGEQFGDVMPDLEIRTCVGQACASTQARPGLPRRGL